jgi:hypothetical protein
MLGNCGLEHIKLLGVNGFLETEFVLLKWIKYDRFKKRRLLGNNEANKKRKH